MVKHPVDPHAPESRTAEFRFYAELNDFLPAPWRQQAFTYRFTGTPSVKDTIEAIGVPHTEIDVILVDGASVGYAHRLHGAERVAVYPEFERWDVSPLTRLRPAPLRVTRFVADVHLGTLARYLRLVGFDTAWDNALTDERIIDLAADEKRIILTRDKGILKHGRVGRGYWLRAADPATQLEEVVQAFDLHNSLTPYTRCTACNTPVETVDRASVAGSVPRRVFETHRTFRRCTGCGRIYWEGSHKKRLDEIVARILGGGGS